MRGELHKRRSLLLKLLQFPSRKEIDMKLAINIAVLLLLVGVVVSDIEEDLESKVLDKDVGENAAAENTWEKIQALLQSIEFEDGDQANAVENGEENAVEKAEEEEPPDFSELESESDDADYQEEVKVEDEDDDDDEIAALQHNENIRSAISHGNTIALQTYVTHHWLGCAGRLCGRAGCPGLTMSGSDWHNCWGEVFQIFRKNGPGVVCVGDLVGLHYPRERGKWLGCNFGRHCGKAPCPGHPNYRYGFKSRNHWHGCWGEVFQIFARGKKNGQVINSDDNIALYYQRERLWFAQGGRDHPITLKLPCLGTSPPHAPPVSKYDGCAYETFRIWKKP